MGNVAWISSISCKLKWQDLSIGHKKLYHNLKSFQLMSGWLWEITKLDIQSHENAVKLLNIRLKNNNKIKRAKICFVAA